MVPPSNPRLMARVLDTISNLKDEKGSHARDILLLLQRSYPSLPRNLTMQVQRALNHAVNAGILRHQSGRYKVLFTLHPASTKADPQKNNDSKSPAKRAQTGTVKSDEKSNADVKSARQRKQLVSSKQDRLAKAKRKRGKDEKQKRLQTVSRKRMQRKANERKERNRVTRHSGVDVSKRGKKHATKKLIPKKSKELQEHQRDSSCSESVDIAHYDLKARSRKGGNSEKGRRTPAVARGKSREAPAISKKRSTSQHPIDQVRPIGSEESQKDLLLEPKSSMNNAFEHRARDEHVAIDKTSFQNAEQDSGSNRSGTGSTM